MWLLRLGANVNRTDIREMTPLHHAARHSASNAARLLIERGANIDARDWQGRTPLDLADAGDGEALVQALREKISTRHAWKVKAVHRAQAEKKTDTG